MTQRIEPHLKSSGSLCVLEIGAAQGRGLIALAAAGHEAFGVEPWDQAREVATQLARQEGYKVDIRDGTAESIPFGDQQFDVVIAMSVMEHVEDLEESLRQIFRVLTPGGVFWFNSASAMSPFQAEIEIFPAFGWYPDRLKRRIMLWAQQHRPAWVGHTDHPALHWWTPAKDDRKLREAGFNQVFDRWDLRDVSDQAGVRRRVLSTIQRRRSVRLAADMVFGGWSYAAVKLR